MANVNIPDLAALTAPAATDEIEVYDASAAANVRLALSYVALTGTANVFTASQNINGGGAPAYIFVYGDAGVNDAVNNNGIRFSTDNTTYNAYIKTYRGSSSARIGLQFITDDAGAKNAMRLLPNAHLLINTTTDSAQLTVKADSTSTVGLVVNTPASTTASAQSWRYNGTDRATVTVTATQAYYSLAPFDAGSSYGPMVYVGRNSNASTPSSGFFRIIDLNNTHRYIWPDASANLRIHTTAPNNANDTSGTVVGTQTSTLASKILLGNDLTPGEALRTILKTPVKHFKYESNAYNGSEFHGIIADYSPEFAMDSGQSFNPVSAVGYLIQAVKALTERIQQLEAN